MLDWMESVVENTSDVLFSIADGRAPTKKQISQLIADGVTIATIASVLGFTEDAIRKIMDDT